VQELAVPAAFVFLPELEGSGGHRGVGLVGAVGAAHDAGLAAGGCTGVAWAPGVEEGDAGAALEEMEGGPAAEGSGTDYGDVGGGFHWNR